MKEIVILLSGAISIVSAILVFLTISSYREKAISLLVVCVIGLAVLGIVFKVCSLIFEPILALNNVFIIGELDRILGGIMGAAEAIALSCLLYYIFDHILYYMGRGAL